MYLHQNYVKSHGKKSTVIQKIKAIFIYAKAVSHSLICYKSALEKLSASPSISEKTM